MKYVMPTLVLGIGILMYFSSFYEALNTTSSDGKYFVVGFLVAAGLVGIFITWKNK